MCNSLLATFHLLTLNFTCHTMPPILLPLHHCHRSISSPLLLLLLSFASKPCHHPPILAPRASRSLKQAHWLMPQTCATLTFVRSYVSHSERDTLPPSQAKHMF